MLLFLAVGRSVLIYGGMTVAQKGSVKEDNGLVMAPWAAGLRDGIKSLNVFVQRTIFRASVGCIVRHGIFLIFEGT